MNQILQQAIDATRAGDKQEAQRQLAQLLKENPDETQAWYLLSLLVESKQQQLAYLGKTLALDPNHEKALERLESLQAIDVESPTLSVSEEPSDFEAQEQGDTLPGWLAPDATLVNPSMATVVSETSSDETKPADDIPDWVQETVGDDWVNEEEPTRISLQLPEEVIKETGAAPQARETTTTEAKPEAKESLQRHKKVRGYNRILVILVVLAFIIAVLLVYALFS
jgi:tetratricopeptide (TPR) repeat protein